VRANARRGVTLGDVTLVRLVATERCGVPFLVLSLHDREGHR
jgi:hypothetical protein